MKDNPRKEHKHLGVIFGNLVNWCLRRALNEGLCPASNRITSVIDANNILEQTELYGRLIG